MQVPVEWATRSAQVTCKPEMRFRLFKQRYSCSRHSRCLKHGRSSGVYVKGCGGFESRPDSFPRQGGKMVSERMVVPEEKLGEVIKVILTGLRHIRTSDNIREDTKEQLIKWCEEMAEYLR